MSDKSIKMAYLDELCNRHRKEDGGDIAILPVKKHGRRLLVGDDVDRKVQAYLRKVRDGGEAVNSSVTIAAARGILST